METKHHPYGIFAARYFSGYQNDVPPALERLANWKVATRNPVEGLRYE